jgi:hypothetical protein
MLKMYRLVAIVGMVLGLGSTATAQTPEKRWSADFGIGFDKGISGNINSGAIGTYNGQTTVVLRQKYEDVYGTGLTIRFGGGYMFREDEEFRVHLTIQSLDADLVRLGDYGPSNLYGQYDDYQSMSLDFGRNGHPAGRAAIRARRQGQRLLRSHGRICALGQCRRDVPGRKGRRRLRADRPPVRHRHVRSRCLRGHRARDDQQ